MVVSGKPEKSAARADTSRGPDFIETVGQTRASMRLLANEFEATLMAVQMASMDELTLLTDLHGFKVLSQLWLDACQELGKPASLLFFDLDSRIDREGALKTFADVLRIAFRESDVVGRVGGDEFAVLLTGSTPVAIAGIRARLQEMLTERHAMMHRRHNIRFKIAQVEFEPARHRTVDGLLAAIDRARHAGCVHF